ncbi:MAG: hypothetical protein LW636_06985 [Planctomycetaceae bacterium]|nr:hypothetical protein [Planctomycetaceae bacterium]
MGTFTWIILIVVLQGVIASLAKKAQEKQGGAASTKGRAGSSPQPTSSTPAAAAPRAAKEDPIEIARRQIDEQIRARSSKEALRAQSAAQPAAQPVVVRRVELSKPRPQVAAKPTAAPKTPKVLARGAAKQPSSTAKPVQPRPSAAPARVEREESAAMSSRQRVADSVAAVRRAETKVDRAMPGEGMRRPEVDLKRPQLINTRTFTATLRDPIRVREAFLLGEVLGAPRSARPF